MRVQANGGHGCSAFWLGLRCISNSGRPAFSVLFCPSSGNRRGALQNLCSAARPILPMPAEDLAQAAKTKRILYAGRCDGPCQPKLQPPNLSYTITASPPYPFPSTAFLHFHLLPQGQESLLPVFPLLGAVCDIVSRGLFQEAGILGTVLSLNLV